MDHCIVERYLIYTTSASFIGRFLSMHVMWGKLVWDVKRNMLHPHEYTLSIFFFFLGLKSEYVLVLMRGKDCNRTRSGEKLDRDSSRSQNGREPFNPNRSARPKWSYSIELRRARLRSEAINYLFHYLYSWLITSEEWWLFFFKQVLIYCIFRECHKPEGLLLSIPRSLTWDGLSEALKVELVRTHNDNSELSRP